MPLPRRRGGIVWPCGMFLLVLRLLEAVHCRQRLFEIRLVPCWYRIEVCHVCVNPPIATVYVNLFFSGFVSVVFTCKLIHLFDDLFRASHLNHRLPEGLVADESVVHAVLLLFTAFSCKLIRRMVFFASRCFSVWPALPDVEVRDGERITHGWAESSVIRCPHVQYIIPVLQCLRHALHCMIATFDSSLKGLNDWCCSRSFWIASFCGWLSTLWIKSWMLLLWERFTVASGIPEMLKSMFSSSIARLNLSASSRFLRWQSSCTLCNLSSLSGCPDLSWFFKTRFSSLVLLGTYQQSLG